MNSVVRTAVVGGLVWWGVLSSHAQETPPPNEPPIPIVFYHHTKDTTDHVSQQLHDQRARLVLLSQKIDTLSAELISVRKKEMLCITLYAFLFSVLVVVSILFRAEKRKLSAEIMRLHSLLSQQALQRQAGEEKYQYPKIPESSSAEKNPSPHQHPTKRSNAKYKNRFNEEQ